MSQLLIAWHLRLWGLRGETAFRRGASRPRARSRLLALPELRHDGLRLSEALDLSIERHALRRYRRAQRGFRASVSGPRIPVPTGRSYASGRRSGPVSGSASCLSRPVVVGRSPVSAPSRVSASGPRTPQTRGRDAALTLSQNASSPRRQITFVHRCLEGASVRIAVAHNRGRPLRTLYRAGMSLPSVSSKRNVARSLIEEDGPKWDALVDEEKRYLHTEVDKQGLQPAGMVEWEIVHDAQTEHSAQEVTVVFRLPHTHPVADPNQT